MKTEPLHKSQRKPLCYDPKCDIHTTPKTNVAFKTMKNPMFDVRAMFPRGSKSFIEANIPLSSPSTDEQRPVQPIVATRRGMMNKTEAEYAMILESMKRKGEILRWEFEGMTLKWFDMRYTPDFVVFGKPWITYDPESHREIKRYEVRFIEVKGAHIHYAQQAMARFKGARGFWPEFTFELHQKTKEGWKQII